MRVDRVVDIRLGDLYLRDEFGQQELIVLEIANRLPERLAVLRILDRLFEDLLGVGDVGDRCTQTLLRKPLHHVDEALVDFADDAIVADAHILEKELGCIGLCLADLVEFAAAGEAFVGRFDAEQRDAAGALFGAGPHGRDHEIRGVTVGDERLRAVDDPSVAVAYGGGLQCGQVRAPAGFGHPDGGDDFSLAETRQPTLLLLVGAQIGEVWSHDVGVDPDAGGKRGVDLAELFGPDGVEAVVFGSGATEFFGDLESEEALFSSLEPEGARNPLVGEVLFDVRNRMLV